MYIIYIYIYQIFVNIFIHEQIWKKFHYMHDLNIGITISHSIRDTMYACIIQNIMHIKYHKIATIWITQRYIINIILFPLFFTHSPHHLLLTVTQALVLYKYLTQYSILKRDTHTSCIFAMYCKLLYIYIYK